MKIGAYRILLALCLVVVGCKSISPAAPVTAQEPTATSTPEPTPSIKAFINVGMGTSGPSSCNCVLEYNDEADSYSETVTNWNPSDSFRSGEFTPQGLLHYKVYNVVIDIPGNQAAYEISVKRNGVSIHYESGPLNAGEEREATVTW